MPAPVEKDRHRLGYRSDRRVPAGPCGVVDHVEQDGVFGGGDRFHLLAAVDFAASTLMIVLGVLFVRAAGPLECRVRPMCALSAHRLASVGAERRSGTIARLP